MSIDISKINKDKHLTLNLSQDYKKGFAVFFIQPGAKETTKKLIELWMNREEKSERLTKSEANLIWIKIKKEKGLSLEPYSKQTYPGWLEFL